MQDFDNPHLQDPVTIPPFSIHVVVSVPICIPFQEGKHNLAPRARAQYRRHNIIQDKNTMYVALYAQ